MHKAISAQGAIRRPTGFTLIELLVVIAIIAILAAILFPVFAQARERARSASCLSNMKQVGLAMTQYLQDNDETFPNYWQGQQTGTYTRVPEDMAAPSIPAARYTVDIFVTAGHVLTWQDSIYPYMKSVQLFHCPSHKRPVPAPNPADKDEADHPEWFPAEQFPSQRAWVPSLSINSFIGGVYMPNNKPAHLGSMKGSSGKVLAVHNASIFAYSNPGEYYMFSTDAYRDASYGTRQVTLQTFPHNDGGNILYADGHAKWNSRANTARLTCYNQPRWNDYYDPNAGCGAWKPLVEPSVG